jgi:hypothetical protein
MFLVWRINLTKKFNEMQIAKRVHLKDNCTFFLPLLEKLACLISIVILGV